MHPLRVLVTAGSTEVPIDQVRSIGNIFHGRTGTNIAEYFHRAGHAVTLLTSSPKLVSESGVYVSPFHTFHELEELMEWKIRRTPYDVIIHSAAVSDYKVSRVLIDESGSLKPVDATKKIPSSHDRLYLELIPTIKLIDQIREPWGFKGTLVKFKLQVGISDAELLKIAQASMVASRADFVVANCLEWAKERAYLLGVDGTHVEMKRDLLPEVLHEKLTRGTV